MRIQTRDRVIRLFMGALLSSELSEQELEEIASELTADPIFLLNLRSALRQSLGSLGEQRALGESVFENQQVPIEDKIVDAIQRRRLSKSSVRDLMVKVAPSSRYVRVTNKMSLREMIKHFLSVASNEDAEKFLRFFESAAPEDQYLKGIVTRR